MKGGENFLALFEESDPEDDKEAEPVAVSRTCVVSFCDIFLV